MTNHARAGLPFRHADVSSTGHRHQEVIGDPDGTVRDEAPAWLPPYRRASLGRLPDRSAHGVRGAHRARESEHQSAPALWTGRFVRPCRRRIGRGGRAHTRLLDNVGLSGLRMYFGSDFELDLSIRVRDCPITCQAAIRSLEVRSSGRRSPWKLPVSLVVEHRLSGFGQCPIPDMRGGMGIFAHSVRRVREVGHYDGWDQSMQTARLPTQYWIGLLTSGAVQRARSVPLVPLSQSPGGIA